MTPEKLMEHLGVPRDVNANNRIALLLEALCAIAQTLGYSKGEFALALFILTGTIPGFVFPDDLTEQERREFIVSAVALSTQTRQAQWFPCKEHWS